jgi:cytoskeletal protein CcmA (bactofilin family)
MSESKLRRLRDQPGGPATLISKGCKITGTISGNGDFQISGEIDGDCDLDGSVSITKSGYWKGTIRAAAIVVSGAVDGDIESTGRVEISDTAKISGTVTGQAIAVAEGAVVEGVMKTTGQADLVEFKEKRQYDSSD